jgi:hypothetical protein
MIIDWHAHIYTPEEAADDQPAFDGRNGPSWGEHGCPIVLENFLDAHYRNGIDISVVSNAAHYLRGKARHEELPAIQKWSDYAAEVKQKHKGVLYSFATILPCGGPAFIKETERAIQELGLKGIFTGRRRGAAVLGIGAGPRRARHDPSTAYRVWRRANDGVSSRLEHWPPIRSVSRPRPLDRARHPRRFSAPQDCRLARWRWHLRDHQPNGLCLRVAGRSLLSRLLRADEDQASTEPLYEKILTWTRSPTTGRRST